MIVWIYEDKVGPYMQTLHFAYALGAALGPLLLRAFFVPIEGNDVTGDYSSAFYLTGALQVICGLALWFVRSPKQRQHELVGNLETAVGELLTEKDGLKAKDQMELSTSLPIIPSTTKEPADTQPTLDQSTFALYHKHRHRLIHLSTFLIFCLLFLYVGSETGYGGFVTTYAVLALGATEATGQLLASGYWWAITAGRFSSSMLFAFRVGL
jgi:fucose permease